MSGKSTFTQDELRYLRLLAKQYPTVREAGTEITNLRMILNLPKGTEHFLSDIHGEHEAFLHILNSCSGEVTRRSTSCSATASRRRSGTILLR